MSTEQKQQQDSQDQQQDGQDQRQDSEKQSQGSDQPETSDSGQITEKPEVTDEHKEKAKEIAKSYDEENLQTSTLPGSDGTVSGTAVTDWVDDEDKGKIETSAEEGNVQYRKSDEFKKIQES
jgi:hypothetical protein